MNERIRELAKQAGWGATSDPYIRQAFDVNMFAESIVRECLEQIYSVTIDNPTDDWDQGYDSGLNQAAETIKEHFGVEE